MYSLAYKTYGHADVELRIRLELGCTYVPEAAMTLNHKTFFCWYDIGGPDDCIERKNIIHATMSA